MKTVKMKTILFVTIISLVAFVATPVLGEDVPKFYKDTYPKHALKSALENKKALMGKDAKLDAKTRALVGLGVAAQIPCAYCVYVHIKEAKAEGASEDEIREAVAMAAHVRHWSTVLNGMAYDFEAFKAEVDKMFPTTK
jgi:AhpD family alkylhydroperoxidase